MELVTHLAISPTLVGRPLSHAANRAVCELTTTAEMAADDRGLVHGGFVFGLADYAAMVAVGDPNVVLGAAESRFTAPVRVGETVIATAEASGEGKKRTVTVSASVGQPGDGSEVFRGTFTCFVLERHVLDKEAS